MLKSVITAWKNRINLFTNVFYNSIIVLYLLKTRKKRSSKFRIFREKVVGANF